MASLADAWGWRRSRQRGCDENVQHQSVGKLKTNVMTSRFDEGLEGPVHCVKVITMAFCLWHLTCFHLLLLAIWVVTLILLILFYFLLLKAFLMSITYHTRGPTTRIKSSRIDWQQSWWRRGRLCKQSFTVYRYKFWLEYLCVSWLQPAFMRIAVLYHTTSIRSHKLKYADGKLHAADLCRCKNEPWVGLAND